MPSTSPSRCGHTHKWRPRMDERPCSNCFRPTSRLRKGMCRRCYDYQRVNGRMRPPSPVAWEGVTQRQPRTHDPDSPRALACINCESGNLYAFSMCHPCRQFWLKHGRQRPLSLHQKKTLCLPGEGPDYCNNPVTTSRRIQVSWPASRTVNLPLCESCAKLFDDEESQQRNNSVPGTYHRPGFTGYAKW